MKFPNAAARCKHLAGAKTRPTCAFLDSVLHLCRGDGATFAHLYRCDAPSTARLVRMAVAPAGRDRPGALRIDHRLARDAWTPGPARVIRLDAASNANRCSLCGSIQLRGEWRDTFARPDPRGFVRSHTIRPTCRRPETADPEGASERVVALHDWRKAG